MNEDGFWESEGIPVPHELFMATIYHDPCLDPLRKAELMKEDGSVDETLLTSWKTTAKLCIERQQCDQECIQKNQDARHAKKQAGIRGARLVQAQEQATEAYHACSKCKVNKARKHANKARRDDDMELDAPLANTSHTRHEPLTTIPTTYAPTPAFNELPAQPLPAAQIVQPTQPVATATQALTNITLSDMNADSVADPIGNEQEFQEFVNYDGTIDPLNLLDTCDVAVVSSEAVVMGENV